MEGQFSASPEKEMEGLEEGRQFPNSILSREWATLLLLLSLTILEHGRNLLALWGSGGQILRTPWANHTLCFLPWRIRSHVGCHLPRWAEVSVCSSEWQSWVKTKKQSFFSRHFISGYMYRLSSAELHPSILFFQTLLSTVESVSLASRERGSSPKKKKKKAILLIA